MVFKFDQKPTHGSKPISPDVQEVEIERHGDTLVIRPVKTQSLAQIMQAFSAFSDGFMQDGRESNLENERDWQGNSK